MFINLSTRSLSTSLNHIHYMLFLTVLIIKSVLEPPFYLTDNRVVVQIWNFAHEAHSGPYQLQNPFILIAGFCDNSSSLPSFDDSQDSEYA